MLRGLRLVGAVGRGATHRGAAVRGYASIQVQKKAMVALSGPDSRKFIQGMTTNDMNALSADNPVTYAAILSPKGRVAADAFVYLLPDEVLLLEVHEQLANTISKLLRLYKLRAKVEIKPASPDFQVHQLLPEAGETMEDICAAVGADASIVAPDPRGAAFGVRALFPSPREAKPPQGIVFENHRHWELFNGLPQGPEIYDRVPLECNFDVLNGVHFHKGCYVGQELIARTQFKGAVRKRVLPVLLSTKERAFADEMFKFGPLDPNSSLIGPLENAPEDSFKPGKMTMQLNGKKVGEFLAVENGLNIGLAMIRLEALTAEGDTEFVLVTEDNTVVGSARPFCPNWWPNDRFDWSQGKLKL